jgi:hypothetical protein
MRLAGVTPVSHTGFFPKNLSVNVYAPKIHMLKLNCQWDGINYQARSLSGALMWMGLVPLDRQTHQAPSTM